MRGFCKFISIKKVPILYRYSWEIPSLKFYFGCAIRSCPCFTKVSQGILQQAKNGWEWGGSASKSSIESTRTKWAVRIPLVLEIGWEWGIRTPGAGFRVRSLTTWRIPSCLCLQCYENFTFCKIYFILIFSIGATRASCGRDFSSHMSPCFLVFLWSSLPDFLR